MSNAEGSRPTFPEVPGYQVLGLLGRGGMGEVYLARQVSLDRLVALKFLQVDGGPGSDARMYRFRREAALMARVSHPHILAVHAFDVAGGRPYLALEYVEQGDLRRLMRPGVPMPVERARAILRPICDALICLHREGVLHRDLKPANVLLQDGKIPKLADFGIAVLLTTAGQMTETGISLGTPGYVAPEQVACDEVDERSDLYSLGCIAFEMLTGQKALAALHPASHYNRRLGGKVDAVLRKAMHEDPSKRYRTVGEFADAIDAALAAPVAGRWRRAGVALLVAAAATALAAVAIWPPARGRANPGRQAAPAPAAPATPAAEPAPAPAESVDPLQRKLVEMRAYLAWIEQGRPEGEAGEAVSKANWEAAERAMAEEVAAVAYGIWEKIGRPTGEEGRRVELINRRAAQEVVRGRLEEAIERADSVPRLVEGEEEP